MHQSYSEVQPESNEGDIDFGFEAKRPNRYCPKKKWLQIYERRNRQMPWVLEDLNSHDKTNINFSSMHVASSSS